MCCFQCCEWGDIALSASLPFKKLILNSANKGKLVGCGDKGTASFAIDAVSKTHHILLDQKRERKNHRARQFQANSE